MRVLLPLLSSVAALLEPGVPSCFDKLSMRGTLETFV
jgi:hypothetical protein